ncbi:MAG: hypothetical protein NTY39_08420 [Campylobacterales bacterium]|nr:hypothetical protein [Campylobacterales bacterium]
MLFQIFDNLVMVLFILFIIYIFRGYHLSKRQEDHDENKGNDV